MTKLTTITLLTAATLLILISPIQSFAQQEEQRIKNLESKVSILEQETQHNQNLDSRISSLESQIHQHGDAGVAFFLFGVFCALWAQNTGRNAWGWFFLGLFFNIITGMVLLYKNSNDLHKSKEQG